MSDIVTEKGNIKTHKYLEDSQNIDILENVVEIRRMLLGLIKYLKSKQSK